MSVCVESCVCRVVVVYGCVGTYVDISMCTCVRMCRCVYRCVHVCVDVCVGVYVGSVCVGIYIFI